MLSLCKSVHQQWDHESYITSPECQSEYIW